MRFLYLFNLMLLPTIISCTSFIQPESDGRSYFAVTIGNALEEHRKIHAKTEKSYTISPAAIQKFFAILYNASEDKDLRDFMLLEMGLKYYDAIRLMELSIKEMTSFDVLKEERLDKLDKPIKRTDVLNFFKNDFNELNEEISYENYVTSAENLTFASNFTTFSKIFFNTSFVNEITFHEKLTEIYQRFDINKSNKPLTNINLLSKISYKTKFKPVFVENNKVLITRGEFRFGEITSSEDHHFTVQVVELPLESAVDLNILLITPKHRNDLTFTTNYEVVRILTDPENDFNVLKTHMMEIKLPNVFKMQTNTDLSAYFKENGLTNAKVFDAPQPFGRMFTNLSKNGVKLGTFKQLIELEINAEIVKELPSHHGGFLHNLKEKIIDLTQTKNFNINEKPFLFILKSKNTIYFMGHYYG